MNEVVPVYELYGESSDISRDFWLHCETIQARSCLHKWEIALHRHIGLFQILYLAKGTADAILNGNVITIKTPTLITVPANCNHGFRFSNTMEGYVITGLSNYLDSKLAPNKSLIHFLSTPRATQLNVEDKLFIEETIQRIDTELASPKTARTELLEAYLTTTLILAMRINSSADHDQFGEARNSQRVESFLEILHQHCREHRDPAFYANKLSITPTHLNRVMKSVTGLSTSSYIQQKLIQDIKRELLFTSDSAQEIGYRFSFTDPAYFTRFFVQHTAQTPRAWRIKERETLTKNSFTT